jgi:hypothetical protein
MDSLLDNMEKAIKHLRILHEVFKQKINFANEEIIDYEIYRSNFNSLKKLVDELKLDNQLYFQRGRQMILADLLEYILIGRGYYSLRSKEDREKFVRLILHVVNLLMSYEMLTVSPTLRKEVLERWEKYIPEISCEEGFSELKNFRGSVGLKAGESEATKSLDKYFDSLLPKTAGGLWHELLVYIFLLRADIGYIVPLLLSQRLIGLDDALIPPDFLVITHNKNIYGIEVGTKKEIQSGSFSIQSNIPTATIDTINSRSSDRCPICKRWIPFCDFVIDNYSNFDKVITGAEIRCLEECNVYSKDFIVSGGCPYTKYSRQRAETLPHTHHRYADRLHYHYRCVLANVPQKVRQAMINAQDTIALKSHYPYYSGLETLMRR